MLSSSPQGKWCKASWGGLTEAAWVTLGYNGSFSGARSQLPACRMKSDPVLNMRGVCFCRNSPPRCRRGVMLLVGSTPNRTFGGGTGLSRLLLPPA